MKIIAFCSVALLMLSANANAQITKLAPTKLVNVPASARALMPRGAKSLFASDLSRAFKRPVLLHVWSTMEPISTRYSQIDVLIPKTRRAKSYKRLHSFKVAWIHGQADDSSGPPSDLEVRTAFLNARAKRGEVVVLQYRLTFDRFVQTLTFPNGLTGRPHLDSSKDEGSPDAGISYYPDLDAQGNFFQRAEMFELDQKRTLRFKWNGREYAVAGATKPESR